ncbi:hypothetical protein TDB9533_00956 [Thalassocella blandensis]|nr:hypothetical protein TDB9533_00956 [Thalassocella blandensis]
MIEQISFEPVTEVHKRDVSISEYYHASIGANKHTLEVPRECTCIVGGQFGDDFSLPMWENALVQTSLANPGSFIAMHGSRRSSVWNSDGARPRFRIVKDCQWDGMQSEGSEFITEEPLSLRGDLPSIEVILTQGEYQYVIFRSLHAVMDGAGLLHFMYEFFRALRGEALQGTNTLLTDIELMSRLERGQRSAVKGTPPYATGGPKGNETGDCWKSIRVRGPKPKLLQRVILGVAEMSAKYSAAPARIAMPVDLRRHFPDLKSTMNYTTMVHFDVAQDATVEDVTAAIKVLMDGNADVSIPEKANFLKILPLSWMGKLVSRSPKNFTKRKILETAVITNIGRHKSKSFSGPGFQAERVFSVPIPGNTMVSIMNMDNDIAINVGTEKVYATEGRLEELTQCIENALA